MNEVFVGRFLVATGIGLLVGFQRESAGKHVAGFRTFTLLSIAGFLCGMTQQLGADWVPAAGLIMATALVINAFRTPIPGGSGTHDPDLTSQVAALAVYLVGLTVAYGQTKDAVIIGAFITLLLHAKSWMHSIARRLEPKEVRAFMQLILIGLIILPLMPNRTFGPYQAFNPYSAWLLIVLMVAISLAGYLVNKAIGSRVGTLAIGLLGGAISSTATSFTYARKTRESPDAALAAAVVIGISSSVVYIRVLVEIGLVHRGGLISMAPPLLIAMLSVALGAFVAYMLFSKGKSVLPPELNPAGLKLALRVGFFFALVTIGVAAANHHMGTRGLYVVAAFSGLTDMDAITLSTARMVREGQLASAMGWRMIMIASMTNMVFKGGMVAILGGRRIGIRVGAIFLSACVICGFVLMAWPG